MTDSTDCAVAGLSVSRETFAALEAFAALVRRWNPAINLVSKSSLADLWDRHIADSAQIFAFCPKDARRWVDIGAGGGFPGIVVAILARECRPEIQVTLVESDLRKATFLRQAATKLNLQIDVRSERIESIDSLETDVLSARALAPLLELLGYAHRHLHQAGVALFLKGGRYRDELPDARKKYEFQVDTRPSLSDAEAAILMIRNIHLARQN
jgi:16S rRNA (guanine527-N7)-methyltransferase